jgi:hypothetical protein
MTGGAASATLPLQIGTLCQQVLHPFTVNLFGPTRLHQSGQRHTHQQIAQRRCIIENIMTRQSYSGSHPDSGISIKIILCHFSTQPFLSSFRARRIACRM